MPIRELSSELPLAVLNRLPTPLLIKHADLTYAWVNPAFESLYGVNCREMTGKLSSEVFEGSEQSQSSKIDRRVLQTGIVEEARETLVATDGKPRKTIITKSRLQLADGTCYLVGVVHDITEVTKVNEQLANQAAELHTLANTDHLTGVLNRRALFNCAKELTENENHSWALLSIDVDHFKSINDQYGHDAGDAALVHFCKTVNKVLRKEDIVARIGGEEFVVLLNDTSELQSSITAHRICSVVEATPCKFKSFEIPLTVSIGELYGGNTNTDEFEEILKTADFAMYTAKQQGRNQVVKAQARNL